MTRDREGLEVYSFQHRLMGGEGVTPSQRRNALARKVSEVTTQYTSRQRISNYPLSLKIFYIGKG